MGDDSNLVNVGNLRRFRRAVAATGMGAALIARESMDVTLTKGDRSKRFWIRPGRGRDEWYCQVWFGPDTQHRGDIVNSLTAMHRLKAQYLREIAGLEQDGWIRG